MIVSIGYIALFAYSTWRLVFKWRRFDSLIRAVFGADIFQLNVFLFKFFFFLSGKHLSLRIHSLVSISLLSASTPTNFTFYFLFSLIYCFIIRLRFVTNHFLLFLRLILLLGDLYRLTIALETEECKHQCQNYLNDERWESHKDQRTDLSASQSCWHHDDDKIIINDDTAVIIWVSLGKVHKESRQRGQEDRETGDCDCGLSLKAEKGHDNGDSYTAASNTCDVA